MCLLHHMLRTTLELTEEQIWLLQCRKNWQPLLMLRVTIYSSGKKIEDLLYLQYKFWLKIGKAAHKVVGKENVLLSLKGSVQRENRGVWSNINTRYLVWTGGVVMGVLLYFNEAAILYRDFNSAPSQKQNIIVFAANNSRCCECYVAPTIIL